MTPDSATPGGAAVEAVAARVFREEWGRIVAGLIRLTGSWDLAEECAQDAFERALARWPRDGVPANPGAWLTTVARHRAMDRLRRSGTEASRLAALGPTDPTSAGAGTMGPEPDPAEAAFSASGIADDRLRLIFTCCHPALSLEAQVALTLRTLAGLRTVEIARAFLVPEETMAKRLVRAKAKIRHANIPYRVPPGHLLPERTVAVLGVLYLLFNEGYTASGGESLIRPDLCAEAIRLARLLVELMPDEPEAGGLLALMLLTDARRPARTDRAGELVLLEDQDRSRWDRSMMATGREALEAALRQGRPGPYQVQAAIAACHADAERAADTDWAQIALLYHRLGRLTPSPVVELNRAVAVAMAEGPAAGLTLVDALAGDGALAGYHLLAATRADLLRRLDRREEAAAAYRQALAEAAEGPERRYLARRLAEVGGSRAEDPPGAKGSI